MVTPKDVLASIESVTAIKVARAALSDQSVVSAGTLTLEPTGGVHNDDRTVALVRVAGNATSSATPVPKPWSAVLKVINPAIAANVAAVWNYPESEEKVYRDGLFRNTDVPFRSAKCFMFDELPNGYFHIWLEDLTAAAQPPWDVKQYADSAYNLGRFNGHYVVTGDVPAGLQLPRNNFVNRWNAHDLKPKFETLAVNSGSAIVKQVFSRNQLASILETPNVIDRFIERASSLPTSLAHGDSHARNLFPMNDHTIAIDWAGIADEPLGADAGVLVGSGLSWGDEELQMVIANVDHFYTRYLDGLNDSGWSGNKDGVRIGFFSQFAIYVCFMSLTAGTLASGDFEARRARREARSGVTLEELPERLKAIAPLLVDRLAEFRSLSE